MFVQMLEDENAALLKAKIALEEVSNTLVPKLQKKLEKYKQQLVDLTSRYLEVEYGILGSFSSEFCTGSLACLRS